MHTRLVIYPELGSTQGRARELALEGESEGLAVMALNQTSGRGRAGRTWTSPPGKNLALSLILRPSLAAGEAPLLGLLTSIAVAETVEKHGVPRAELKWPNDVLVNGLKIAGILPEAHMTGGTIDFLVVGVGLNVNGEPSDFPPELRNSATSIRICIGESKDLEVIARDFLRRMEILYERAVVKGCSFVTSLWMRRWAHLGARITREGLVGAAEGVTRSGALIIRTDDGRLHQITCGEAEPVLARQ